MTMMVVVLLVVKVLARAHLFLLPSSSPSSVSLEDAVADPAGECVVFLFVLVFISDAFNPFSGADDDDWGGGGLVVVLLLLLEGARANHSCRWRPYPRGLPLLVLAQSCLSFARVCMCMSDGGMMARRWGGTSCVEEVRVCKLLCVFDASFLKYSRDRV